MNADWMNTATGRRVLQHATDSRPTWLWSVDGATLLWSNPAAELFLAKTKKHGVKLAPLAVPIKGQLGRIARLGSLGRTSLSRVQFLAGDKPASNTCACTPLEWLDGQVAVLVVGVDPIAPELLAPESDTSQTSQIADEAAPVALMPEASPPEVVPQQTETPAPDNAGQWQPPPVTEPVAPAENADPEPTPDAQHLVEPVATEPAPSWQDEAADASQLAEPAPADNGWQPATAPAPSSEVEPPVEIEKPQADNGQWQAEPSEPAVETVTQDVVAEQVADASLADEPQQDATPESDVDASNWHADSAADTAPPPEMVEDVQPEIQPELTAAAPESDTESPEQAPADAPVEGTSSTRLTGLFDRMAANPDLFAPLTDADDLMLSEPPAPEEPEASSLFRVIGHGFTPDVEETDAESDEADLALLDGDGGLQPDIAAVEAPEHAATLRHEDNLKQDEQQRLDDEGDPLPEIATALAPEFAEQADALHQQDEALAEPTTEDQQQTDAQSLVEAAASDSPPDPEVVERVSRYNFDELSRILTDRVGDQSPISTAPSVPATTGTGALINLGGETLVLNRLPLGILVFRDQQVLFANRAITEMVGYDSVEQLRSAGLGAIFPALNGEGQEAGPVNHLVQRSGALVPVTARLQSISWQGRPALMLSASATEVRTGHEAAVRAFAEAFAEARQDGYFETNRAGTVSANNGQASQLLGGGPGDLIGRALINLISAADQQEFRAFLERPARFAETARPAITVAGAQPNVEIQIFAQGQAGVIGGYFGFAHKSAGAPRPAAQLSGEPEPALLARISRGVRRPLNTIIGFSDLIRSEAFGALQNERYSAYAEDIRTAGHEIAALVDELDDYARLKDGRYLPQRASIELGALLESCVQRVRQQAGSARVIVRSAISEKLPRITADRASLAQAVLNLMASAIDQTPTGGAVIISAQTEDDGAIGIHVRDSATDNVDMAERFVVFRDGVGRDGQALNPVRSSVGLALTRSLLAVNAFSLTVDPAGNQGTLFSLLIPADLVDYPAQY